MTASIGLAKRDDLQTIVGLLEGSGLPHAGLREHLATTLVVRDGQLVVGSAALEIYGTAALLRSVAVEHTRRGRGLGKRLTLAALDLARQRGVTTVYLLTETASGFFARFGFRPIPRSKVVPAIRSSVEFTTACPESAQVMVMKLSAHG